MIKGLFFLVISALTIIFIFFMGIVTVIVRFVFGLKKRSNKNQPHSTYTKRNSHRIKSDISDNEYVDYEEVN